MTTPAQQYVDSARALVGAKWRHRGRKPWALDCIGLLVVAAYRAGLTAKDEAGYGREPWEDRLAEGLRERFGEPVTDWRAGDIAVIRWAKGEPSHTGILANHPLGGLSIIHAHTINGVVEHALRGPVLDGIVAVFRPFPDPPPAVDGGG